MSKNKEKVNLLNYKKMFGLYKEETNLCFNPL